MSRRTRRRESTTRRSSGTRQREMCMSSTLIQSSRGTFTQTTSGGRCNDRTGAWVGTDCHEIPLFLQESGVVSYTCQWPRDFTSFETTACIAYATSKLQRDVRSHAYMSHRHSALFSSLILTHPIHPPVSYPSSYRNLSLSCRSSKRF